MKTTIYSRAIFGASSILAGVVSLIWRDAQMWQRLRIWNVPFASAVGIGITIALIAGGAAIMFPRFARSASVVLGAVYGLFTLACISDMIATPSNAGPYVVFFEQLSIVCGAIAVYAATDPDARRSAAIGRAARLGLGICAVSFAWAQIVYLQHTVSLVPTWIPPNQIFWTNVTTVAFGLAAIAILINYRARLAMRLMALMLALFGVVVWVPRIVTQPGTHSNWTEIAANYLISSASSLVADVRAF